MTVTVYTLPNCTQCNMTKSYMKRFNIEFTEVALQEDAAAAKMVMEDLGYKSAPVVITDDAHWSGFKPELIVSLVND